MNTALWIIAGFLTALFLFSGVGKVVMPRERMARTSRAAEWVLDFDPRTLRAIGAAEILGALGLLLPALLDVATVLVPLAALGLTLVMTGAVILRISRHERAYALSNLVLLALAAFVAVGRFGPEPLAG